MLFEYNHPQFYSDDEEEYDESHKLSSKQQKFFRELQEAVVKYQATIKMLEKAQIEVNFTFSTFWGAINKDHPLYGRRAVIDEDVMKVRLSKR